MLIVSDKHRQKLIWKKMEKMTTLPVLLAAKDFHSLSKNMDTQKSQLRIGQNGREINFWCGKGTV